MPLGLSSHHLHTQSLLLSSKSFFAHNDPQYHSNCCHGPPTWGSQDLISLRDVSNPAGSWGLLQEAPSGAGLVSGKSADSRWEVGGQSGLGSFPWGHKGKMAGGPLAPVQPSVLFSIQRWTQRECPHPNGPIGPVTLAS